MGGQKILFSQQKRSKPYSVRVYSTCLKCLEDNQSLVTPRRKFDLPSNNYY